MDLGALVDLDVDKDYLIYELKKLGNKECDIHIKKDRKKTKVEVILKHKDKA